MAHQVFLTADQVKADHAASLTWRGHLNVKFGDALGRCLTGAAIANGGGAN